MIVRGETGEWRPCYSRMCSLNHRTGTGIKSETGTYVMNLIISHQFIIMDSAALLTVASFSMTLDGGTGWICSTHYPHSCPKLYPLKVDSIHENIHSKVDFIE